MSVNFEFQSKELTHIFVLCSSDPPSKYQTRQQINPQQYLFMRNIEVNIDPYIIMFNNPISLMHHRRMVIM